MKAWSLIFAFAAIVYGQTVTIPTYPVVDGERVLLVKGRIAGEMKQWMAIEAHNGLEWKENGFDPCLTRVVVDYMPMMHKLPNGEFEIMFVSPIAKDLP